MIDLDREHFDTYLRIIPAFYLEQTFNFDQLKVRYAGIDTVIKDVVKRSSQYADGVFSRVTRDGMPIIEKEGTKVVQADDVIEMMMRE